MKYAKPIGLIVALLAGLLAVSLMSRNSDVRKCEAACARATLACAAQQSGPTTSTGVLACQGLGKMCDRKCEDDMKFRAGMAK